ncbi:MAG: hypothetical protein HYR76_11215 [Ignavibacteria bacterium]|nr:hypothetical protein [Ignavibacteria bacterium]
MGTPIDEVLRKKTTTPACSPRLPSVECSQSRPESAEQDKVLRYPVVLDIAI